MKKLILALMMATGIAHADTTSPRMGLTIPACNSLNWCNRANGDYTILDTTAASQYAPNTFTSSNTFNQEVKIASSAYVTGKIGIGAAPAAPGVTGDSVTVAGIISSTKGGVRYPDGTLQTTAATGITLPTQHTYSASGTFTTPVGARELWVRAIGGGGGGAGASDASSGGTGGNGGDTIWDVAGAAVHAGGGHGGVETSGGSGIGGAGGSSATGTASFRQHGNVGGLGFTAAPLQYGQGGQGGSGPFGGQGIVTDIGAGGAGTANTGAGGSGAGQNTPTPSPGGGGGGGEYIEIFVTSPSGNYNITIGAGGTAGSGTNAGGAGGTGFVVIEARY